MERKHNIKGWSTFWLTCLMLLTLMIPAALSSAVGLNSLTIHKIANYKDIHNITDAPTSGTPVAGAVFEVWFLTGTVAEGDDLEALVAGLADKTIAQLDGLYSSHWITSPTDGAGATSLTGLNDGLYYVRQVESAGTGYATSPRTIPFLVHLPMAVNGGLDRDVDVYPKDNPAEEVTLIKYGLDGTTEITLTGVKFQLFLDNATGEDTLIYVKDGKYVSGSSEGTSTLVTDAAGRISISGLPIGKYYFKELEAPAGYQLLTETVPFEITEDAVIVVKAYNKKFGGEKFIKIEDDCDKPLSGAKFKVTTKEVASDGKVTYKDVLREDGSVYLVTSGPDGRFEVTGLAYGTYYLVETVAPTGFKLLKEPYEFIISATSYDDNCIVKIINKKCDVPVSPKPGPGHIKVPPTGDVQAFIYLVTGASFMLLGRYFYKGSALR